MVDQVLLALQAVFLLLLYLFIWRVIRSAAADLRAPHDSLALAASPPSTTRPAAGTGNGRPARLVVVSSSTVQAGSALNVGPVPVTIGRSSENSLPLERDLFASGQHARIEAGREGVWVTDLGSTNGTLVNGERVEGRRLLNDGDVLKVGSTELRFER